MRVKCSKLRRKNINDVLLWCKEAVTLLGRMQLQVSFMLQTFFWKFIKIPEALVTLEYVVFQVYSCSQGEFFYLQMEGRKCFCFGL